MKPIRVGPIAYDVEIVDNLQDDGGILDGRIRHSDAVIQLAASLSPQAHLVTLWHEVLHTLFTQAGIHDHDEKRITALSYDIVQVLTDNPQLRSYEDAQAEIPKRRRGR